VSASNGDVFTPSWRRSRSVLVCLALTVALAGCRGRPRTEPEDGSQPKLAGGGHVSVFDLSSGAPESTGGGGLFPLPARQTFVGLVRAIDRIAEDRNSAGIFVRLGEAQFGLAQAQEIGELFGKLRDKGKTVTCHTHSVENSTSWLLQRGCTKIWLTPAGDVSTVGLGAQMVYLKGAMDRLGIEADMLHMGKYKSGAEPLTREGPTEPSRQNLTETLGSLRSAWLDGVRKSRKTNDDRVIAALEDGPWSPTDAKAHGLVDEVGFPDQALDAAKSAAHVDEVSVAYGRGAEEGSGNSIAEIVRLLSGADERTGGRPHIAVVPAVGSITMTGEGPLSSGGITARATARTLERLRKDESVRAVVLRIDSPGGSPLASDLIWREMMLMRPEKPIVASVGGMAASGGYYIVSGATKIVADPSSIVGSIGVFGGKVVFGKALSNIGVTSFTFPASPAPGAGERAAHLSPLVPWDDATREKVRVQMQGIYELFLQRVAEGRALPIDKVRATAEGAIFSATVGKERGLVDELGGLSRALDLARELAHLDADTPVVVEGAADNLLETLFLGEGAEAGEVEAALARFQERQARFAGQWPGLESLRPFSATIAPLLAGEAVVAALPYVIEVR
jgi:protease IV